MNMDKIILKIYHLDNSRPAFYAIVTKLNKRQAKTFSGLRLFYENFSGKVRLSAGGAGALFSAVSLHCTSSWFCSAGGRLEKKLKLRAVRSLSSI